MSLWMWDFSRELIFSARTRVPHVPAAMSEYAGLPLAEFSNQSCSALRAVATVTSELMSAWERLTTAT